MGLGTLLLPGAALADTTVSPATTPVGGTVVLTATTCNPKSGDAIFRVTGPNRDQNVRSTTAAAGGGLSAELFTAGFTLGTYTVAATCGDGSSGRQRARSPSPRSAAPRPAPAAAPATPARSPPAARCSAPPPPGPSSCPPPTPGRHRRLTGDPLHP